MANTNGPKGYLDEILRLRNQAVDQMIGKIEEYKTYMDKQTDTQHKEANRASSKSYMEYNDPYGAQAESLSQAGLAYSGVKETSYGKSYNAYQNALSNAAASAQGAKNTTNMNYLGQMEQANAQKLQNNSDYYDSLYNDYWNNKQMNYYEDELNDDGKGGTDDKNKPSGSKIPIYKQF